MIERINSMTEVKTKKAKRTEAQMIADLKGNVAGEATYIVARVQALRAKEEAYMALCSSDKVRELVDLSLGPQEF